MASVGVVRELKDTTMGNIIFGMKRRIKMIDRMTMEEMADTPKEELENYIVWLYQYIDRLERKASNQCDRIEELTKDTTTEQRKSYAELYSYTKKYNSTIVIEPQLASLLEAYFEANHESSLGELFNRYH